ncbi:Alpha/Beta hydrolase protein, partial [Tricladium varicosporioides]
MRQCRGRHQRRHCSPTKFFEHHSTVTSSLWHLPSINPDVPRAMTILVARVAHTRWPSLLPQYGPCAYRAAAMRAEHRHISSTFPRSHAENERKPNSDPRINDLGRAIKDDFATIRENYATPKYPIVLAHGLLGFDELKLGGEILPGIHYWRGITDAMRANGIEVITASVPASASIEERAMKLGQDIAEKANGKSVNIIAHSMGGLDARYMISKLKPENVNVLSLTTIASPHRGSSYADFFLDEIGPYYLPRIYKFLESRGIGTGAFNQLTRKYMRERFNPSTPDLPGVRYFSYGATFDPGFLSWFRQPHSIVDKFEGPNDGLVSVESAKWGTYKGTLVGVSHLDLINWKNRVQALLLGLVGVESKFNAIAFYLDIADMLAKEGL